MISQIIAAWQSVDYDFRDIACETDPLAHLFDEWVDYYRLKWAIAKVIQPTSILEIGVRYGYSAFAFLAAAPQARYVGIDIDSADYGGEIGALDWAKKRLTRFDAEVVVADSQSMTAFPGDKYDLIHVDGQQDGDSTYADLVKAIKQAKYILVDGYFWSEENTQGCNAFLQDNKALIEYYFVIPGYAGELLIKVDQQKAAALSEVGNDSRVNSSAIKAHYGNDYYLGDCGGYREYHAHKGQLLADPRLDTVFQLAAVTKDMHVVDAGCGRGELSYASVRAGATVDAVDYSSSAVTLAKDCFADEPAGLKQIRFHCASITDFDFSAEPADRVIASDLIEHLAPEELDVVYRNVAGGLKSDGQLVIHTFPNLWYYRYGYAALRKTRKQQGVYISPQPRSYYEQLMHINEQSPRVLRDQLLQHFAHVLVWFGSFDQPLDSLMRPYSKTDCINAPSLFAIASHQPIDAASLRQTFTQQPLSAEQMAQTSVELLSAGPGATAQQLKVNVSISNHNPEPLKSVQPNPVNAAYHWLDENGSVVVFDGTRTALPRIDAEQSLALELLIDKPQHQGPLTLQLGLVQEGVAWFENCVVDHLVSLTIDN